MGLFSKLLGLKIVCPSCGAAGAKDGFVGVKCWNRDCRDYDPSHTRTEVPTPRVDTFEAEPYEGQTGQVRFENALEIVYLNARNETKTFRGDRESVCWRGSRISVPVEPTGCPIILDPARIQNRDEVERLLPTSSPDAESADFRDAVDVEYENHRGERKTFRAARNSIRTVGAHISLRVAPKGTRITLARERIQNLNSIG